MRFELTRAANCLAGNRLNHRPIVIIKDLTLPGIEPDLAVNSPRLTTELEAIQSTIISLIGMLM